MQKSYGEMNQFIGAANAWLERNPNESKFSYAIKKVVKSCLKLLGEYQEQVEEISITHCAVDKDGVILRDERGGFRYTKDELKKRNKKVNDLFKSAVEIEPYFATEIPKLTEEEREVFLGFVLKETQEGQGITESGSPEMATAAAAGD